MNRKLYRICLVMVIALSIVSGVLYYQYCKNQEIHPEDGTLVWTDITGREYV